METEHTRLHRLWNKLAALSINMNILQEYLPTIGSLKAMAERLIERGDLAGPAKEPVPSSTLLKEIPLDVFYEDLTSLVHESSACIEDLKKELAQLEQGLQGPTKEENP